MKLQPKDLEKILHAHSLWVLSGKRQGRMANLDGWNLNGAVLEMANLPFARFQSASLRGAILEGANLRQATLVRANLNEARLTGADFEGADLSGADLSFAECNGTYFVDANLEGIIFQGANLNEASFKGANLRGANFKNAILSFAEMNGANLEDANFEGANLEGTDFTETSPEKSNLEKNNFEETYLRDLEDEDYLSLMQDEEEPPENRPAKNDSEKINSNQIPYTKESKENLFVDSKVIDQGMIAESVGDFIKKMESSIDPDQVKEICKSQYGIENIDKIDFEGGDIVSRHGQVTFRLDFKISHKLTLFIDRRGKLNMVLSHKKKEAPST